jgi:hypothetical protein
VDPRKVAEELLRIASEHERAASGRDTLITQVLIDGTWFNVDEVTWTSFHDGEGASNVAIIKAVPV